MSLVDLSGLRKVDQRDRTDAELQDRERAVKDRELSSASVGGLWGTEQVFIPPKTSLPLSVRADGAAVAQVAQLTAAKEELHKQVADQASRKAPGGSVLGRSTTQASRPQAGYGVVQLPKVAVSR